MNGQPGKLDLQSRLHVLGNSLPPVSGFVEGVRKRIDAEGIKPQRVSSVGRIFTVKTLVRLAAAVLIAVMVAAGAIQLMGRRANLAFGDVLQAVRAVHSLKYRQTISVTVPGSAQSQIVTGQGLLDDAGRLRFTTPDTTAVFDFARGKTMILDRRDKLALMGELADQPLREVDLLEEFRKLDVRAGKPIQAIQIDGRRLPGFQTFSAGQTMRVWVDPDTHLPVKAEVISRARGLVPASEIEFSDLAWNVPVDPALMSLAVPRGYREMAAVKIDLSAPSEQSLLDGLRALATMNMGTFPGEIGTDSLREVLIQAGRKVAKDAKLKAKMMSLGPGSIIRIAKMWDFISDPKNGSDWHYAGNGIQLGQAVRAIFWYKPAGSADYHVIDADMKVYAASPNNLPDVPSQLIELTSAGQPPATQPATRR